MNVDAILSKMNKHRADAKAKGTFGEKAAIEVLRSLQAVIGGVIFHSYDYEYSHKRDGSNYAGNIKYENGQFVEIAGKEYTHDEIDILYITDYRIFVVEVKARANRWTLYDHWAKQQGTMVDKSPVLQCEKHARHFYHKVYEYLPEGDPRYIIPLVVFVDKSKIKDDRSQNSKQYVLVTILNALKKTVAKNNVPLAYKIDKDKLVDYLCKHGGYESIWKKG